MVIPDAYVCGNCPGASDSNPGTSQRPVATIGRGIQNAIAGNRPIVFIAASYNGSPHIYSEDITLVEGRSLQGRWNVLPLSGSFAWSRTGTTARTTLQNTAATGLKSPIGVTTSTFVEGMTIRQANLSASRLIGIQVNSSSPTLREITVQGPLLPGPLPTESVGIDVLGGFAGPASPIIGIGSGPSAARNAIAPAGAVNLSTGLVVTNARVQVSYTDFLAGTAGMSSRGAYLSDSPTSTFLESFFAGGLAQTCYGFFSQGGASGTLLERVTASGCPRNPGTTILPQLGYGIAFDACGSSPGGSSPVVRNSSATGGTVGGAGSTAVGGSATDGCDVRFEQTSTLFSSFTGGAPATSGPQPESTVAILCSYRGLRTPNGADSRCSVSGSTLTGGTATTARSYGLSCEGSCATRGSACLGSCDEIVGNTISAQTGSRMSHVIVTNSSPQVRQNRIGFGGNGTFCNAGALVRGVETMGAGGSFVNNLILGGSCSTAIGVEQVLSRRSVDNSVPSTTFHSNTIGSAPPFATTINGTIVSVGVSILGDGSPLALQSGVWRNNVVFAGPVTLSMGVRQAAFEERVGNADPLTVQNNLFHVYLPLLPVPLYVNEGSTVYSTAMGINGLMDMISSGNVAGDPLFTNPSANNYTLGVSVSPASRAGMLLGAPVVDLTNAFRPNPVGTFPDIGCYEANF